MYGCHPSERIFFHSFGLLSPRSVIAIARIAGGMATDKRLRLGGVVYPLAGLVGGHDDPLHGDGASPIDHAHDDGAKAVGEHCRVYASEVAGLPQRQDPSRQRRESGRGRLSGWARARSAVGSVASHSRRRCRTAENPPVKVRAAMTALWHPIWSVMVPNDGGRDAAWSVAASDESGDILMGSA